MHHDQFVGKVQHRAQLASRGDAEMLIRVTFETLGERLLPASASHVAAQLPPELGRHLRGRSFEHLSVEEFCDRVAARENEDPEKARFHARCVFETLREALSPGAVTKIERQLPTEFRTLLRPVAM